MLAVIGLVATLASTALSIYSAVEQADAQEKQLQYEADRAREAGLAKQAALAREADRKAEEDRKSLSTSINVLGGRGLDISTGSPLLTLAEQYSDSLADANEIKRQGSIAYLTGLNQEGMLKAKADSVSSAVPLTAAGIGLAGVGSGVSGYASATSYRPRSTTQSTSPGITPTANPSTTKSILTGK